MIYNFLSRKVNGTNIRNWFIIYELQYIKFELVIDDNFHYYNYQYKQIKKMYLKKKKKKMYLKKKKNKINILILIFILIWMFMEILII